CWEGSLCLCCSTRSRAGPPKQTRRSFVSCFHRPGCAPNTTRQSSARLRSAGSPMLKLKRIFKNYEETGSLNEQVNLYGFVDSHMFLTKTGDLGVVVEVRGVDYECLDQTTLASLTKRLESAFKLLREACERGLVQAFVIDTPHFHHNAEVSRLGEEHVGVDEAVEVHLFVERTCLFVVLENPFKLKHGGSCGPQSG